MDSGLAANQVDYCRLGDSSADLG